jgi:hypothetical protein
MSRVGKGSAICYTCNSMVTTTCVSRDLPMFNKNGGVDRYCLDIMVYVCDKCDNIISMPSFSSKKIGEQRELFYLNRGMLK